MILNTKKSSAFLILIFLILITQLGSFANFNLRNDSTDERNKEVFPLTIKMSAESKEISISNPEFKRIHFWDPNTYSFSLNYTNSEGKAPYKIELKLKEPSEAEGTKYYTYNLEPEDVNYITNITRIETKGIIYKLESITLPIKDQWEYRIDVYLSEGDETPLQVYPGYGDYTEGPYVDYLLVPLIIYFIIICSYYFIFSLILLRSRRFMLEISTAEDRKTKQALHKKNNIHWVIMLVMLSVLIIIIPFMFPITFASQEAQSIFGVIPALPLGVFLILLNHITKKQDIT